MNRNVENWIETKQCNWNELSSRPISIVLSSPRVVIKSALVALTHAGPHPQCADHHHGPRAMKYLSPIAPSLLYCIPEADGAKICVAFKSRLVRREKWMTPATDLYLKMRFKDIRYSKPSKWTINSSLLSRSEMTRHLNTTMPINYWETFAERISIPKYCLHILSTVIVSKQ